MVKAVKGTAAAPRQTDSLEPWLEPDYRQLRILQRHQYDKW